MKTMTFVAETRLTIESCCNCGMMFAMPHVFYLERRRDHKIFYCPAGHPQHYAGESDEERLRRELSQAQQFAREMDAARIHAEDQRQAAERRLKATKAAHTRTKNRIAHGVCPCCNRSFENLARHMETKHPEYKDER